MKVVVQNKNITEDSFFIDVESIFCDSGFSRGEALMCNIRLKDYGNMIHGVEEVVLDGIEDITIKKGGVKAIHMQFNKIFDKPTECRVYNVKEGNRTIECTSK